ncbi:MAG: hypothetical protein APR63_07930 [Desulfuromonas sp. SDB]|nr:MAG: hypothetical protein APR63_07930 [Desulfuromonas sp. SDB]
MDTKLTLKLDKQIIESAKKYAKNKNISLSKMIEFYLKSLVGSGSENIEITPFVDSISGVIKLSGDEYKEGYFKYLNEKYK